jgi:hypothetical protein
MRSSELNNRNCREVDSGELQKAMHAHGAITMPHQQQFDMDRL